MKATIISADHFEDTGLLAAYCRLKEQGFEVDDPIPAHPSRHDNQGEQNENPIRRFPTNPA